MMTEMTALVASALLTWLMLGTASLLRSKGWTTPGMRIAFGNRDDVPEPSPLAGRADRAAGNMLENLAIFTALIVAFRSPARPARKPSSAPACSSGRGLPIGRATSPGSSICAPRFGWSASSGWRCSWRQHGDGTILVEFELHSLQV